MNKSESIIELAKALSKFQGEVKQPKKDKVNPHFKSSFVSLDGVVETIAETASKYGLSYIQFPVNLGEQVGVYTVIMHESGEYIESEPIFTNLQKKDPQGVGAALTYLRRYSLSAVFGIASETDDDAEGAMDRGNQYQQPKQQYQKPQQQSPAPQQSGPKMISPPQLKAVQTKVGLIAKRDNTDAKDVYAQAIEFCQIKPGTSSKDLTIGEATKLIGYLATLEQQ